MMLTDFPLFPEQASTVAGAVDALFIFLCVLTGSVSILVFFTIFFLAIKYRRTPTNELAQDYEPTHLLEFAWIIGPSIIFVFIFIWGSWLYFHLARVPDHAGRRQILERLPDIDRHVDLPRVHQHRCVRRRDRRRREERRGDSSGGRRRSGAGAAAE